MIISHKYKFIFIKPQKTAGTSVELMLSRICGPDDVITPLGFDPDPNVREKHHAKPPQNFKRSKPLNHWTLGETFWFLTRGRKPHLNYREHLTADTIRTYVGDDVWNSYLKISIVRNPWDHALSQYFWMKKYNFGGVDDDFKNYLLNIYKVQWPYLNSKDKYCNDYVLRFENLSSGLLELEKLIGVNLSGLKLPVTKKSSSNLSSYRSHYNTECSNIVFEKNISLLHYFKYDF